MILQGKKKLLLLCCWYQSFCLGKKCFYLGKCTEKLKLTESKAPEGTG